MDFQRILLSLALAFTILMLWQAWQQDYGPKSQQTVAEQGSVSAEGENLPAAPAGSTSGSSNAASSASDAPSISGAGLKSSKRIDVYTDLFHAVIDTHGGDLRTVELLKYPQEADKPDQPVQLISDVAGEEYVVQSGLLAALNGGDVKAPTHNSDFSAQATEYRLEEGKDKVEVVLSWQNEQGVTVEKVYTFHRDRYLIDIDFRISNASAAPFNVHLYRQLRRSEPEDQSTFIYTYTGGVIYSEEEKYEKIDFGDMADSRLNRDVTGGWVAMIEHYFLSAWIPPQDQRNNFYTLPPKNGLYTLGMTDKSVTAVAPGESAVIGSDLFVGPKLHDRLVELVPGLELTVDFGILTIIAEPIFWLLRHIHDIVGNWGWSIIILTILIKLAFFKLSATSYRSMAQMRKMQPRMKALQEQYGDDKQGFSQAMMQLYKKEKINPLGGCLPILVQIPVFIALYWVLLESVEMRQADFALWLNDLSSPDPYFILPLLMGVTMLIQQKLNPTPLDPIQARVMMLLPVIFTVFFLWFPAGLVLYWVVNNTLSIAQQWYITRVLIKE